MPGVQKQAKKRGREIENKNIMRKSIPKKSTDKVNDRLVRAITFLYVSVVTVVTLTERTGYLKNQIRDGKTKFTKTLG
jgi:hypothetical protein